MPYPAAGAALREAVGKTSGSVRAGLIDSLGERREAASVAVHCAGARRFRQGSCAAAAWALGKIGTMEAAAAARAARTRKPPASRLTTIGQGLVLCARNLVRADKKGRQGSVIFCELTAYGRSERTSGRCRWRASDPLGAMPKDGLWCATFWPRATP